MPSKFFQKESTAWRIYCSAIPRENWSAEMYQVGRLCRIRSAWWVREQSPRKDEQKTVFTQSVTVSYCMIVWEIALMGLEYDVCDWTSQRARRHSSPNPMCHFYMEICSKKSLPLAFTKIQRISVKFQEGKSFRKWLALWVYSFTVCNGALDQSRVLWHRDIIVRVHAGSSTASIPSSVSYSMKIEIFFQYKKRSKPTKPPLRAKGVGISAPHLEDFNEFPSLEDVSLANTLQTL